MTTDNTQAKQTAMEALQKINAVEGFDPSALAVEYTDLNSANGGEKKAAASGYGPDRLVPAEISGGAYRGFRHGGEGLFCGDSPGLSPLFRTGGSVPGRGDCLQRLSAR